MKTKQLANVLIKILGLSVVVHSIPSIITAIYSVVRARPFGVPGDSWFFLFPLLLLTAIGVYLVIQSRQVTGFLFQNEEE
jgi:hypothetical protein